MANEQVFDNEYATILYDQQTHIVQNIVKKSVPVPNMKELLNKVCDTLKARGASKLVTDGRKTGTMPLEFEEWRTKEWIPRMVHAGWKHWAAVLPSSAIAALHMNRFAKDFVQAGINVHPAADLGEAMKWLENQ